MPDFVASVAALSEHALRAAVAGLTERDRAKLIQALAAADEPAEPAALAPAAPPALVVARLPEPVTSGGVDNDAAALGAAGTAGKIVWHVRHGESEANLARQLAKEADKAGGKSRTDPSSSYWQHWHDPSLLDAPLSPAGVQQAEASARKVAAWATTPTLVLVSPLTRALQTASIVFAKQLAQGSAQLLVRPELREFFPTQCDGQCQENRGRPLAELLACPKLQVILPTASCLGCRTKGGVLPSWPWRRRFFLALGSSLRLVGIASARL